MRKSSKYLKHPWTLGAYAIYAPNIYAAREAYERISSDCAETNPCGVVTLESGEAVSWLNICYAGIDKPPH